MTEMGLEKLDSSARTDLISRIEELKKTADTLIAQIKAAPVKETPPAAPKPKKVTKEKKEKKLTVSKPKPKKETPKKKPTANRRRKIVTS